MESQPFLLEHTCSSHHVQTVENIIKRVMSLTSELLPIQVDLDSLTSPTSDLLTQKVVNTYKLAGGDFQHIVSPAPTSTHCEPNLKI